MCVCVCERECVCVARNWVCKELFIYAASSSSWFEVNCQYTAEKTGSGCKTRFSYRYFFF